jgi:hypothetical protein
MTRSAFALPCSAAVTSARRRARAGRCYDDDVNAELRDKGYVGVPALIEPSVARLVYRVLMLRHWRREYTRDDQVSTADSWYHEALIDTLLCDLRPRIEAIASCPLVPTYARARLYFSGDRLERHRDRESCEVSASIHLGRDGGDAAIWFEPGHKVDMQPGDGAIYLGRRVDHWRDRFAGDTLAQMFLHYVVADGQFAHLRYDGRPELFPPSAGDL